MTVLVSYATTSGATEEIADGDFRNPKRVWAWARGMAAEIASAGGDSVSARSPSNAQTQTVCHAQA